VAGRAPNAVADYARPVLDARQSNRAAHQPSSRCWTATATRAGVAAARSRDGERSRGVSPAGRCTDRGRSSTTEPHVGHVVVRRAVDVRTTQSPERGLS
jgi:hypothetical protein